MTDWQTKSLFYVLFQTVFSKTSMAKKYYCCKNDRCVNLILILKFYRLLLILILFLNLKWLRVVTNNMTCVTIVINEIIIIYQYKFNVQ